MNLSCLMVKIFLLFITILLLLLISNRVGGSDNYSFDLELYNAVAPLQISSYEGSGQITHPDVIYIEEGWNGYRYWMVFTPYPGGNSSFENPSLRCSHDGVRWEKPSNLMPDPIIPAPVDVDEGGFNSDPDIVLVGNILYLYYRTTTAARLTTVYCTTSQDAIHWSAIQPTDLPGTTTSPAFYYDGSKFYCWFVDYSGQGNEPYPVKRYVSDNGIQWINQGDTSFFIAGYTPWHINVIKTLNGFEMLVTAYLIGSNNAHTVLFHASSVNGISWRLTRFEPVIKPVIGSWDSREIYRAAMLKESNGYKIWYSAADTQGKWGVGYITIKSFDLPVFQM